MPRTSKTFSVYLWWKFFPYFCLIADPTSTLGHSICYISICLAFFLNLLVHVLTNHHLYHKPGPTLNFSPILSQNHSSTHACFNIHYEKVLMTLRRFVCIIKHMYIYLSRGEKHLNKLCVYQIHRSDAMKQTSHQPWGPILRLASTEIVTFSNFSVFYHKCAISQWEIWYHFIYIQRKTHILPFGCQTFASVITSRFFCDFDRIGREESNI